MSAPRRFDPITVPAEVGFRRVHRLACSACRTVWDISANTHCGARASEDIARQAGRHGWTLGRNAHRDLCSDCARVKRERGRGEHLSLVPAAKEEPDVAQPTPAPKAEPPREMSRLDRRLITAKLEEVYADESVGYGKGWTDVRVAEDLGVPRAWIEKVREDTFGPHGESADLRAIGEALAAIEARQTALAERQAELFGKIEELWATKKVDHAAISKGLNDVRQAARAAGLKL